MTIFPKIDYNVPGDAGISTCYKIKETRDTCSGLQSKRSLIYKIYNATEVCGVYSRHLELLNLHIEPISSQFYHVEPIKTT